MKIVGFFVLMLSATCFGQSAANSNSSTPMPFTEKISMCKLNAAMYVGGTCSSAWGRRDIGGQINAAYQALFPLGGTIYVLPQTGGGCYSFSTPIAFSTAGEYAILGGLASTNQEPSGGACLNFTPVNGSAAITLDYTPGTGGGYGAAGGLRDLTLINGNCFNNGGCGSSAIGIMFGAANTGAQMAELRNVKVNGFGTGIALTDPLGVSWGLQFENLSLDWNTTGLSLASTHENIHWFGGSCSVNSTCVDGGATTSDIYFYGVSVDGNTMAGIVSTGYGINFHCFGCHFENNASNTVNFLSMSGGTTTLVGGLYIDDTTGGTIQEMFNINGGMVTVDGASMYSAGQTISSLFNLANGAVIRGSYVTAAPAQIQSSCTTPDGCFVQRVTSAGNAGFTALGFQEQPTSPAVPPGYDYCYGDAGSHAIKCSFNGDAMSAVVRASDLISGAIHAKIRNLRLANSSAPLCDSKTAGILNYSAGAAGVKDTVQVCAKDATNNYAWRKIY